MYRSVLTTRDFWIRTLDRCIKAAATAGVAVFTTNVVDITSIDWLQALSIMFVAAIAMFLVCLAELPINKTE